MLKFIPTWSRKPFDVKGGILRTLHMNYFGSWNFVHKAIWGIKSPPSLLILTSLEESNWKELERYGVACSKNACFEGTLWCFKDLGHLVSQFWKSWENDHFNANVVNSYIIYYKEEEDASPQVLAMVWVFWICVSLLLVHALKLAPNVLTTFVFGLCCFMWLKNVCEELHSYHT
jgi:hypothetical protein